MTIEPRQMVLEGMMGKSDVRSSGSLTRSKDTFLVDADDGYEMDVDEQMVFIDLAAATAFNITLPSVKEAAGRLYVITPTFAAGSVTISDLGGDAGKGDISATTAQTIVLFSTGYKWCTLHNAVTT